MHTIEYIARERMPGCLISPQALNPFGPITVETCLKIDLIALSVHMGKAVTHAMSREL